MREQNGYKKIGVSCAKGVRDKKRLLKQAHLDSLGLCRALTKSTYMNIVICVGVCISLGLSMWRPCMHVCRLASIISFRRDEVEVPNRSA